MTTTSARHPGSTVQLAIHHAVRRDVARPSDALAPDDATVAPAVRSYWAETAFQLHHPHLLEDSVIWPLMATRLGSRAEALLARNVHGRDANVCATFGPVDDRTAVPCTR